VWSQRRGIKALVGRPVAAEGSLVAAAVTIVVV